MYDICVTDAPFGAMGDGRTDDTAALQRAYDALTGAGRVVFPPGVYLTRAPIIVTNTGVMTQGAGIDITVLRCQHSGNGFTYVDHGAASLPLAHWAFADLTVAKDGMGGHGIACTRAIPSHNPTIPSLTMCNVLCRGFADIATQWWTCGIYSKNGSAVSLRDVAVIANGPGMTCGILLDNDPHAARYNLQLDGINIQGGQLGVWVTGHCENVRLTNYEIVGQAICILLDGTTTQIPGGQNPVALISHGHANAKLHTIFAVNWKGLSVIGADTYSGVGVEDTDGASILVVNGQYVSVLGGKVGTGVPHLARQGIALHNVRDVQISTTVEYCTAGGVVIVGETSDRLHISGSLFVGYPHGFPMAPGVYVGVPQCRATVVGNTFSDCTIGVYGVGRDALITGNNFHACAQDVVWAGVGTLVGQNRRSQGS